MVRIVILITFVLSGCGRYAVPLAPELLAPAAVEALQVQAKERSVLFAWRAVDVDQRKRELKSSDGFRIMRKNIQAEGDESNPDQPFIEVGFLPDAHVAIRESLRKVARAEGKIGRRVEAPSELMDFVFEDSMVESGKTYLYQIVPINQGSVKGQVAEYVRLKFDGLESKIFTIDKRSVTLGDEIG